MFLVFLVANSLVAVQTFNTDISGWNTAKVTDMSSMFEAATSFNQDISAWDVSSVTSFAFQFSGAFDFNQDGTVDQDDVDFYVESMIGTSAGDADVDR